MTTRVSFPDEAKAKLDRVELTETESITLGRESPEAVVLLSHFVERAAARHAELLDDLTIAVQVVTRDQADSGERILLDDFIREQGLRQWRRLPGQIAST